MGDVFTAIDPALAVARERALAAVREGLRTSSEVALAEPVIPVDVTGWESVIRDAGVAGAAVALVDILVAARALGVNDPQVIGGRLRHTLLQAVALQVELRCRAEQASWFVPPAGRECDRGVIKRIATLAPAVIGELTDALTATSPTRQPERWHAAANAMRTLAATLADRPDVNPDTDNTFELVFGMPADLFRDRRGVIDSARIRAAFADRPDELEAISRRLLASLLDDASIPPDAAVYAASFSLSERPLIAHEVARETLKEITACSLPIRSRRRQHSRVASAASATRRALISMASPQPQPASGKRRRMVSGRA